MVLPGPEGMRLTRAHSKGECILYATVKVPIRSFTLGQCSCMTSRNLIKQFECQISGFREN